MKHTDIITTSFRSDYQKMKTIRKEKQTFFVPNGVEVKQHDYVEFRKKNWKRMIYISSQFGKARSLSLEYLLDIADLLCGEFEDVKIWIVGKDGPLKALSHRKSVSKGFVEFLGYISSERLNSLYEQAAIGILPNFGEIAHSSQRTKTLEYLVNGLLVVSAKEDLTGFCGLKDGIHCIAVESKDDMANKLRDVLSHPDKYIQIASKGRQFVIERYLLESVTKEYVKLIGDLVSIVK